MISVSFKEREKTVTELPRLPTAPSQTPWLDQNQGWGPPGHSCHASQTAYRASRPTLWLTAMAAGSQALQSLLIVWSVNKQVDQISLTCAVNCVLTCVNVSPIRNTQSTIYNSNQWSWISSVCLLYSHLKYINVQDWITRVIITALQIHATK